VINFEHVSKRYANGVSALRDVSFNLDRGEMAFLTGHSGAGKSTLLRLVLLLERASGGRVRVNGHDLDRVPSRRAPYLRQAIGMIFQDHRLLPDRTVLDNVAVPLLIAGLPYREIRRRVRSALDQVGLGRREDALPNALSGGEQQRVGIARAIVGRPPVLLADEPTGNLDPDLSQELFNLFSQLHGLGTTVLIASHDLALIRSMGKRVLVLSEGRLVDDIAAEEVGGGRR
jgi:cell division transport system ATP-binding protein